MGRVTILSKITTFILTGGRRTTASGTRDVLTEMANSYVSCIYDSAADFTSSNPVLETKQHGVETDNLTTSPKFKIGDGVTDWNSLPYANSGNGTQTLQEVLANGNTMLNSQRIKSEDTTTEMSVSDGLAYFTYQNGLFYSSNGTTSSEAYLYFENSTEYGYISVTGGYTKIEHTVAINLNSPSVKKNGVEIATLDDLGTWFEQTSTISGTTLTLQHTPVSDMGYFLEGQRLFVGGKITSIVGTLVTFDDDYTGANFTETYRY